MIIGGGGKGGCNVPSILLGVGCIPLPTNGASPGDFSKYMMIKNYFFCCGWLFIEAESISQYQNDSLKSPSIIT